MIDVKLSFNNLRNPTFDRAAKESDVLLGILIGVLLFATILVDEVGSALSDCNSIADKSIEPEVLFDPVHLMK